MYMCYTYSTVDIKRSFIQQSSKKPNFRGNRFAFVLGMYLNA